MRRFWVWLSALALLGAGCGQPSSDNTASAPPSTTSSSTTVASSTEPPTTTTTTSPLPPLVTYRYSVASSGAVQTDIEEFAAHAAATYADPRGWSQGGSVRFERVASGGQFTLWLATAAKMSSFSSACTSNYSCNAGTDVVINETRWLNGGGVILPLDDYRHMVVNHETGHWLGLGHKTCPGKGQLSYVMQQQSKGGSFVGSCLPNAWPRAEELTAVAPKCKAAVRPSTVGCKK